MFHFSNNTFEFSCFMGQGQPSSPSFRAEDVEMFKACCSWEQHAVYFSIKTYCSWDQRIGPLLGIDLNLTMVLLLQLNFADIILFLKSRTAFMVHESRTKSNNVFNEYFITFFLNKFQDTLFLTVYYFVLAQHGWHCCLCRYRGLKTTSLRGRLRRFNPCRDS